MGSLPEEELHLCIKYQDVGIAIASAASLRSALFFTHNLATCEPSHPQGFSSFPTWHLSLPLFLTHAPKILPFKSSNITSPVWLVCPHPGLSPKSQPLVLSFVMSCKFVCTHAIIQATAFNYLFACLQKRGQVLPTLAFSEVAQWMWQSNHYRNMYWINDSEEIFTEGGFICLFVFAYHLTKLFQSVHLFQDNALVSLKNLMKTLVHGKGRIEL